MKARDLTNQKTFLRELLEYLDWTPARLAGELRVSEKSVMRWLGGEVSPHPPVWKELENILKKMPLEKKVKKRLQDISLPYIVNPHKLTAEEIFTTLEKGDIADQFKKRIEKEFPDLASVDFRTAFAEYVRRKSGVAERIVAAEIAEGKQQFKIHSITGSTRQRFPKTRKVSLQQLNKPQKILHSGSSSKRSDSSSKSNSSGGKSENKSADDGGEGDGEGALDIQRQKIRLYALFEILLEADMFRLNRLLQKKD
ncbi:MAG: hypothetical protein PHH69_04480 [Candidatus Omnitrophica bacterium]|nr:hypothetical protein [Candidatus Omnitrophota bacterium]